MFAVGDVLISDDVLNASFSCNLGACLGGCCVQGDSGAPLEPEEREELVAALPRVRKFLRPEALKRISEAGVWEEIEPGQYATTCVNNAECVFVVYEGEIAKCSLQKAFYQNRITFEKPISCHLYPLRVERIGSFDTLNYEQIDLCAPGRKYGAKKRVLLTDFLRKPLSRKFGAAWYEQFRIACQERCKALGLSRD